MDDLDVVVLGTGLSESITAAALSKAGYSVAHVDTNPYYGGDDASLTADELITWADARAPLETSDTPPSPYLAAQRQRFTSISRSGNVPPQSRQFSISLSPTLVPSVGPLIDSLIASGVSRYGGFKLLERVALYESPRQVKPVPANKEDVFKNKQLSLIEKRRLMRFLMFAGGEFEDKPELQGNEQTPFPAFLKNKFSLNDDAVYAIAYALAFCVSESDPTLHALQRVRRYLRSTGRYGPSPFLVGHYGGVGEIAQGFCRTSAVGGAMYILGRDVTRISPPSESRPGYDLELEDFEDKLHSELLVSSPDYLPAELASTTTVAAADDDHVVVAHCIAIIDTPIRFSTSASTADTAQEQPEEDTNEEREEPTERDLSSTPGSSTNDEVDTALLVFPPKSVASDFNKVAVDMLVTGEGSMSAPRGQWILYIVMPLVGGDVPELSAEALLRPYLDAALTLTAKPATSTESAKPTQAVFSLFYKEHTTRLAGSDAGPAASSLVPSRACSTYLPEIADSAASNAETMFWQAVTTLKAMNRHPRREDTGKEAPQSSGGGGGLDVDSFWPPLDYVEDDSEDW